MKYRIVEFTPGWYVVENRFLWLWWADSFPQPSLAHAQYILEKRQFKRRVVGE